MDGRVLLKTLKSFAIVIVLIAAATAAGIVLPRPIWRDDPTPGDVRHRILVLSNPIHSDIAVPVDADILARFGFLRDGALDLYEPNLRYIIFGWGGRSFYTETPTWADLKAMPVFKSFSLDNSVMHVSLAGDIPLDHPSVMAVDVGEEGYRRLLGFVRGSFASQVDKPMPLAGFSYGENDAFFEPRAISTPSWGATPGLPRRCARPVSFPGGGRRCRGCSELPSGSTMIRRHFLTKPPPAICRELRSCTATRLAVPTAARLVFYRLDSAQFAHQRREPAGSD